MENKYRKIGFEIHVINSGFDSMKISYTIHDGCFQIMHLPSGIIIIIIMILLLTLKNTVK